MMPVTQTDTLTPRLPLMSKACLRPIAFIVRLEWLQARRQRLSWLATGMLTLLGLSVCVSFSSSAALLAEPMAALTSLTALWSLALPLMALMAGFRGIAAEREGATLGLLLTQGLGDTPLLLGKWLGGALPLLLGASVAALVSVALYLVADVCGSEPVLWDFYAGLIRLWFAGMLLILACHLSTLAISAWCLSSQSALFIGLGWLGALLLLWDLLLLLAVLLGVLPPWLLEGLMHLNPVAALRDFVSGIGVSYWVVAQLPVLFILFRLARRGMASRSEL